MSTPGTCGHDRGHRGPGSGPSSKPAPPGRWPCGWPPCTSSSGRCRPGETILLDALYADLHKSHAEGYMCELGPEPGRAGLPGPEAPPVGQAPAPSHPPGPVLFLQLPAGRALRGGAGDVPWNYPYLLSLDPLFGAIAAGNCVVLKPSAYAPNTSRAMAELIAAVFPRTGSL